MRSSLLVVLEQQPRPLQQEAAGAFSVIADASEEAGGTPAIPASTPEAYPADFAPPAMTQHSVKLL